MDNGYVYVAIGDWPEDGTGDNNVPFLVDASAKSFSTNRAKCHCLWRDYFPGSNRGW